MLILVSFYILLIFRIICSEIYYVNLQMLSWIKINVTRNMMDDTAITGRSYNQ